MNTRVGLAVALALGAGLLLHAGEARADRAWQPMAQGYRIGLETDLWPTSNFTLATMDLFAQLAVHPNVMIDIDLPWAFGGGGGRSNAAFGNPTLGVHVAGKMTPALAGHAGFTISIPTRLSITLASLETAVFATLASSSRAFYDYYRLSPELVYMRFPLGLEVHAGDYFYYRGDLNPIITIPVGEDNRGASAQLLLEHADEFEGRAPIGFGGGVRLQFVFGLTDPLLGPLTTDRA
jgi:hypothetical protein